MKKARLAFEMLQHEMDVMSKEELKEIIGGDGIIESGSGTYSNPYIISSTVVYFGNNPSVLSALNFNSGTIEVGGKYYQLKISTSSNPLPMNISGTDNSGKSFSFKETYIREVGDGYYGRNKRAFGTATHDNSIALWGGTIDDVNYDGGYGSTDLIATAWTKDKVIKATTWHEVGHTLGLDDGATGVNLMNPMQNQDGYIVGGPGSFDSNAIKAMLTSGKIHDMTASTGTIQSENPAYSTVAGSTGLINQYQDNDGDWWSNFYYYDNEDPQYKRESGGPVTNPSFEFSGYSTGYVNITTNTYYVNDDFLPFIPESAGGSTDNNSMGSSGYSTGNESTGG